RQVINPAYPEECVGFVEDIEQQDLSTAITQAVESATHWSAVPIHERAELLRKTAQLIETHFGELLALLMRESGKTLDDAIGEWREAVDFLRYYADQAVAWDKQESGQARGVIACIAPWNFPLSIFTGQIAAALVTGNSVLAKPAEQATLIAYRITQIFHQAGIPLAALQLLPGEGESVGAELCKDARLAGICFTGSLEVAQSIRKSQAEYAEIGAALIAETGGINAMIVDSTALPEQTVQDILTSAFSSAGQRCSALRIVYLQEDVADRFVEMLMGAMDSLHVGDPWQFESDLGPVIDKEAYDGLRAYIDSQELLHKIEVPAVGHFVSPVLIEVSGIADIEQEIFGPVLHVAQFKVEELDQVIDQINLAGYGLTCSIQSRLTQRVDHCIEKLRIGNLYVNRNQIGAVVESQPFGGSGLSGTGPKAGGPLYLHAFTRSAKVNSSSQLAGNSVNIEPDSLQRTVDELSIDDWESLVDRKQLLQSVSPGSRALMDSDLLMKQQMPGPTGERNIYQLCSNACALCLGPTPTQALEQALQALVFGGAAVVCCEQDEASQLAVSAMKDLDVPVRWLVATPTLTAIEKVQGIDSVSWCGDHAYARQLMQALAARKGAILPLITELLNPQAYLTECHVCSDISSSGGNVELMSNTDL
ncbi:MAG: L-glutamate gamma-semialdehyde dehydrogenase, partial [Gammaproteobacteria bacterium]|nr:L-glutamate gamma-semialdehyde dehydrogenase [Gammaproteobacteria bacterium]